MATVGELYSFGIEFTENLAIKVTTSNGLGIEGATVTVISAEGSEVVVTDTNGVAFFYILSSQTLTISVEFNGLVQSEPYVYTYSPDLVLFSFDFPLPLRYTQSNSNNFFRWYKPNENATLEDARNALNDCVIELSDPSSKTSKPVRYNTYGKIYTPQVVIIPNVPFSFYANLDSLEDSANFANWRVDVVTEDLFSIEQNVIILTKDVISGSEYRFYAQDVTFPVVNNLIDRAVYRLCIIDTTDDTIVYLGEIFQYRKSQPTYQEPLKSVKYRNDRNILNYNYVGLPSLYQEFYIKLHVGSKRPVTTQQGYEVVSGSFNPVRSTTGSEFRFITQAYGKEDHAAFNAMTIHKDLQIVIENGYKQYVRGSSDYSIDYGDLRYQIADGEITLQQKPSFTSNKTI